MIHEKLMKTETYKKQFGVGPYATHNVDLLNFSSEKQIEQIKRNDYYEKIVANWLTENGVDYEWQEQVLVLGQGGKINHAYVADFVVNNIVIEVDGASHYSKRKKDAIRDSDMRKSGFETIRIETDELDDYNLWDKLGFLVKATKIEEELQSKYNKGPHAKHNKDQITFIMNRYRQITSRFNIAKDWISTRLAEQGVKLQECKPLPIVSKDGKIETIYLGGLVSDRYKMVIEVDPMVKKYSSEHRDKKIAQLGYYVIRVSEVDLWEKPIDEVLADHVYPHIFP